MDLPADVLTLVFEQHIGDSQTLSAISRVSKAWRYICLPILLHTVDLSCHNLGRRLEHESDALGEMCARVYADQHDKYRPHDNLVPRQRAFLRLLNAKPELAFHVKSFTWTLIWLDFEEETISDIDRQLWSVFQCLHGVTQLDLASLHELWEEPYVRENPDRLFPAVRDLRLVGWMHRGLVSAIINALDTSRLHSLRLDYLQDEGAMPGGEPISSDIVQDYASCKQKRASYCAFSEGVIERQTAGKACIFPGPMWLPLRILQRRGVSSLMHLRVRQMPFDIFIDLRNYYTMCEDICGLMVSAKATLQTITVAQGESPSVFSIEKEKASGKADIDHAHSRFDLEMTTALLDNLLATLTDHSFTNLTEVKLEGFRIIEHGLPRRVGLPDLTQTWRKIDGCPYIVADSIRNANIDCRRAFIGHEFSPTKDETSKVLEARFIS